MSASFTPQTALPSQNSTPGFNGNGTTQPAPSNGNNPSSSLYLFTFLATLLLLLAVSCAIVIRSFILRRRYRRRMEEAFASGIMLPPSPSQRRRYFGEKPLLWDAFIAEGSEDWVDLQPISARILSEKFTGAGDLRKKRSNSIFNSFNQLPLPATSPRPRGAIARWWRPTPPSSPSQSTNDIHAATVTAPPPPDYEEDPDAKLQVSVLVQMPMLPSKKDHVDEEIPDVMFGITEIPWRIRNSGVSDSQS